jgi:AcrR family transcriptional regulator
MHAGSKKTEDRRVRRTRTLLRDALVASIVERGWEGVSVLSICERAGVGRSTFYAHFADKEELLVSGFEDLERALAAAREGSGPFAFVEPLVDHVAHNRKLFRALVGKRSGEVVHGRFRELVMRLVSEDMALAGVRLASPRREAAVRYVGGALVELLTWWLDRPSAIPAPEVAAAFRDLTRAALQPSY